MAISTNSIRDRGLERVVRRHFKRGICELASLASLINVQEDPSIYVKIREHIKRASIELTNAEALTQWVLEKVDSESLEMMALRKKLTDEQKERNEDLASLRAHLEDLEISLEENMLSSKGEKARKENTRKDQWLAESEVEKQRKRKSAALWSMLIPVVGTVVGAVVAFNAHGAMKKAVERATTADDLIDQCRGNEQKYYREVKICAKQLEEKEAIIQENQRRIKAIEREKHKLVTFHEETLNMQEALRRCTHFVGTLASKANAVNVTSRYICIYESLRQQLEEINRQVFPLLGAKGMEAEELAALSSLPSNISEVEITRL